jgi:hypothetical protein
LFIFVIVCVLGTPLMQAGETLWLILKDDTTNAN